MVCCILKLLYADRKKNYVTFLTQKLIVIYLTQKMIVIFVTQENDCNFSDTSNFSDTKKLL